MVHDRRCPLEEHFPRDQVEALTSPQGRAPSPVPIAIFALRVNCLHPEFTNGERSTSMYLPLAGSYQWAAVVPVNLDMPTVIVRIVGMYAIATRPLASVNGRAGVGCYRTCTKESLVTMVCLWPGMINKFFMHFAQICGAAMAFFCSPTLVAL